MIQIYNLNQTIHNKDSCGAVTGIKNIPQELFTPWNYKMSWIRSLATRAKPICSVNLLPQEINETKKFASWNGFPKSILTSIIKLVLIKSINDNHIDDDKDNDDNTITFYLS